MKTTILACLSVGTIAMRRPLTHQEQQCEAKKEMEKYMNSIDIAAKVEEYGGTDEVLQLWTQDEDFYTGVNKYFSKRLPIQTLPGVKKGYELSGHICQSVFQSLGLKSFDDKTLWRGSFYTDALRKAKEGDTILLSDGAFASTSENKETAENFANGGVVFKINNLKGWDITKYNPYDECEVVAPRFTTCRIKTIEDKAKYVQIEVDIIGNGITTVTSVTNAKIWRRYTGGNWCENALSFNQMLAECQPSDYVCKVECDSRLNDAPISYSDWCSGTFYYGNAWKSANDLQSDISRGIVTGDSLMWVNTRIPDKETQAMTNISMTVDSYFFGSR